LLAYCKAKLSWLTLGSFVCCLVTLQVARLEPSRRYLLTSTRALTAEEKAAFAALVHDRMTEQVYSQPAQTFKVDAVPAPVFTVPVMEKGRAALEDINSVGSCCGSLGFAVYLSGKGCSCSWGVSFGKGCSCS
jgi:hypothetical protein